MAFLNIQDSFPLIELSKNVPNPKATAMPRPIRFKNQGLSEDVCSIAPHWNDHGTILVRHGSVRANSARGWNMVDKRLFDDINERVRSVLAQSPAADLEKNLRVLLAGWFSRLDLVTREEFDVQREVLRRAQDRLQQLEARLAELEADTRRKG
jgi:BMFP domain-containing protein YqiC